MPGHEIVGRVSAVGAHVGPFREGDLVGVSCMVDSRQACASCDKGLEQYCEGTGNLVGRRRFIAGSMIGGIAETKEMLDFCAEHGIVADIEMIPIQKIEDACARMLRSDVKYRFVIDSASLTAA